MTDLSTWLQMMMRENRAPQPMDILAGIDTLQPKNKVAQTGQPLSTGSIPGIQTPDGGYAPATPAAGNQSPIQKIASSMAGK
jgi:hypothetical protein